MTTEPVCEHANPRTGETCTRPPDHQGDHGTFDPSSGFSRYWKAEQ